MQALSPIVNNLESFNFLIYVHSKMKYDWNHRLLSSLPSETAVIPSGDERLETYSEDTMFRGSPDAVLIARDAKEISEVLKYCSLNKIPVTFCGSQTSMTGASVPLEGLLISTEALEGVEDIYHNKMGDFAVVKPGTVISILQKVLDDAGFFYPVAPTSRDMCRIGSNIATNATGEDSYKYGPVRNYVESIDIILQNGKKKTLKREAGENPTRERNKAGYYTGWKNPIDLLIGSEGTLAFIERATLRLLPKQSPFFSGLIPFKTNRDALRFVIEIAGSGRKVNPRTLELIDSGALNMMKTSRSFPKISDEIGAFLYIKQEYLDEAEMLRFISRWYDEIINTVGQELADQTLIALNHEQREDFRLWRHRIPEAANELGRKHWKAGGGKVGSDWWVPMPKLNEMMEYFYGIAEASGLPYMGYAHIGAGHPHTNFLARNPAEKEIALDALFKCCKKAVALGGGVAGEHGIGKIHTDLMSVQHQSAVVEKMKSWKQEYDPRWILGRGNIFGHL